MLAVCATGTKSSNFIVRYSIYGKKWNENDFGVNKSKLKEDAPEDERKTLAQMKREHENERSEENKQKFELNALERDDEPQVAAIWLFDGEWRCTFERTAQRPLRAVIGATKKSETEPEFFCWTNKSVRKAKLTRAGNGKCTLICYRDRRARNEEKRRGANQAAEQTRRTERHGRVPFHSNKWEALDQKATPSPFEYFNYWSILLNFDGRNFQHSPG